MPGGSTLIPRSLIFSITPPLALSLFANGPEAVNKGVSKTRESLPLAGGLLEIGDPDVALLHGLADGDRRAVLRQTEVADVDAAGQDQRRGDDALAGDVDDADGSSLQKNQAAAVGQPAHRAAAADEFELVRGQRVDRDRTVDGVVRIGDAGDLLAVRRPARRADGAGDRGIEHLHALAGGAVEMDERAELLVGLGAER